MNRYFKVTPSALILIVASFMAFWAGCSKDETPTDVIIPPKVELLTIICNPLAPSPGQTALLTVQPIGTGGMGQYEWQVSGGTLVDNGTINVSWQAPTEPGIYRVFVRAKVGTAVDTTSSYIMVRRAEIVETGIRYCFYPNFVGGDLYFVGSPISMTADGFFGFHAYRLGEGASAQITVNANPRCDGGFDFTFFPDAVLTSVVTGALDFLRRQPMNIISFPYFGTFKVAISNNEDAGTVYRKNQHVHPSATQDLSLVVWQYNVSGPGAEDGTQDLVNIAYRVATQPIKILTEATIEIPERPIKYYQNILPMFTPDEETILYFSNKTDVFEPCLIPLVEGVDPDTTARRTLNIFRAKGVKISEKTVFQWNPNPAGRTQLGFIDDAGIFYMFDYVAEQVDTIASGVKEFAWSADGKLAGISDDGVYILEPGQTIAKRVFAKERSTDDIIGVNWSPGTGDQRLGFRIVRKGASNRESFSALVIYSLNDDRWYYASPRIDVTTEPSVNYTWMRPVFDQLGGGMYAPVPIPGGGGRVVLYYSY